MVDNIWSKEPPINCDFLAKTSYVNLMKTVQNSILESTSEEDTLNGFRNLRALLKYHPEVFITVFDNLYDTFKKFLLNENQEILVNSLVLINETFSQNLLEHQIGNWIYHLLPYILKLMASKNLDFQIRNYSEKIMDKISSKSYSEEIFYVFLDHMAEECEDLCLLASKYLYNFLKNQEKFYMINAFDWNSIIEEILDLYILRTKRELALGLLNTLRNNIFNEDEFLTILSKVENDDTLISLNQITHFDYSKVHNLKLNTNSS